MSTPSPGQGEPEQIPSKKPMAWVQPEEPPLALSRSLGSSLCVASLSFSVTRGLFRAPRKSCRLWAFRAWAPRARARSASLATESIPCKLSRSPRQELPPKPRPLRTRPCCPRLPNREGGKDPTGRRESMQYKALLFEGLSSGMWIQISALRSCCFAAKRPSSPEFPNVRRPFLR